MLALILARRKEERGRSFQVDTPLVEFQTRGIEVDDLPLESGTVCVQRCSRHCADEGRPDPCGHGAVSWFHLKYFSEWNMGDSLGADCAYDAQHGACLRASNFTHAVHYYALPGGTPDPLAAGTTYKSSRYTPSLRYA